MGGEGREEGSESGIGRKLWTREIEPYFLERIKTSSPTSDLLPPQISPAPFALLSLLRDCHASCPTMHDALSTNLNGVHLDSVSAPDSPTVDSAATPVNHSLLTDDIKIDVDFTEQESDARHEPAPLKLEKLDALSTVPQLSTPVDPSACISAFDASFRAHGEQGSIPIAPPAGTPPPPTGELLPDVKMAEENAPVPGEDVEMSETSGKANGLPNGQTHESPIATPVSPSLPAAVSSSETAVDSHAASSPYNNTNANNDDDDHDKPPPAKRARKYSDAERASLANVSTFCLLCATMGVLIYLFSSRSEDRYSTSSLRFTASRT